MKKINENKKNGAIPITFEDYINLNTNDEGLSSVGIDPVEWNADNFIDDKKSFMRAQEILKSNPNITPGDVELKIMAIRAAIRKCPITDIEKREAYMIEMHAHKLLRDWLACNFRGNSNLKYVSENKILRNNKTNNNMKKNVVKLNENTLRKIVAESVKKVLKENAWASAPSFKELEKVLDKVTGILSNFSNNIPQEQSDEFMKLVGREWNDLWKSLSSLEETVMRINNPRGLSDGDLTFDDLS